jgi:hypothetical protein
MEVAGLRIRIPSFNYLCMAESCFATTEGHREMCGGCEYRCEVVREELHAWVREKVTPATFTSESEIVHSAPLRRYLSG